MCESAQRAGDAEYLHDSSPLNELELELDVVGDCETALGKGRVPVQAELCPIDDRLEYDAELDRIAECHGWAIDCPTSLDRAGIALDRQLAIDDQVVGLASERGRAEVDLGIALNVEEFGRPEVGLRFSSLTTSDVTSTVPRNSAES